MFDYIIQVILFQTLFIAVYDIFLKKETFFQWNRAYLLATSVAAYCIPLIKLTGFQEIVPQEYMILLPEVVLSPTTVIQERFDWGGLFFNVLQIILVLGAIIAFILFALKLYQLTQLIAKGEKQRLGKYRIVFLEHSKAFSFFNYIFLGKSLTEGQKEQIIAHELVHVRQKHSLDLFLFELQKILCWFNPLSYVFQKRIAELHEFIADGKTVKETDKKDYFQNLLSQTFDTYHISFINSFLKISLIKKRIVMLNKDKSKQLSKFKYVLLIPVLLAMLLYSSCENNEMPIEKESSREALIHKLRTSGAELDDDELNELIDALSNALNAEDSEAKREEMKALLYTYLAEKNKELLTTNEENSELQLEEVDTSDGMPFAIIAKSPIFPGCEGDLDPKACFNRSLQRFVAVNFDASISTKAGLKPGKKRIYVQFKIDKNGDIVDVKARAPHKALEKEATRTILSVPKLQAGEKENGEKVTVKYMLPITFNIQ